MIYGVGKWSKFFNDPQLHFANKRNERSVGVKWKNLNDSGVVIFDLLSKRWSVTEPFRQEYPEFDYFGSHLSDIRPLISTAPHTQEITLLQAPPIHQTFPITLATIVPTEPVSSTSEHENNEHSGQAIRENMFSYDELFHDLEPYFTSDYQFGK